MFLFVLKISESDTRLRPIMPGVFPCHNEQDTPGALHDERLRGQATKFRRREVKSRRRIGQGDERRTFHVILRGPFPGGEAANGRPVVPVGPGVVDLEIGGLRELCSEFHFASTPGKRRHWSSKR